MSARFLAGALLILSLTFISMCGYIVELRAQRSEAKASLVARELELAGAKEALEAKPKEITKFVEKATAPIIKYIKSGEVTPIAGVKVEATSEVVHIPCPSEVLSDTLSGTAATKEESGTEPTASVVFGVEAQIALSHVPHKGIFTTSSLQGMAIGDSWHLPITFPDKETKVDVRVDPNINKALDYYDRSWIRKHTSLLCPGVGVTYNPLDINRPVNVGVVCAYGFTFF